MRSLWRVLGDLRPRIRGCGFSSKAARRGCFNRHEDVKQANQDFRRWIQKLRRSGLTIEYAKITESTKRGRIHFHALVWVSILPKCTKKGRQERGMTTGCYCPDDQLCVQKLANQVGFGFVDARLVRGKADGAARYVAKYLVKSSTGWWPRYARRLTYSRAFSPVTLGELARRYRERIRDWLRQKGVPVIELPAVDYWQPVPATRLRSPSDDDPHPLVHPYTGEILTDI